MNDTITKQPAKVHQLRPADKVAAMRRVKELESGKVQIPMACAFCYSPALESRTDKYDSGLYCLSCGRKNQPQTVKTIRRQRIRRYITTGDLPRVK